MTEPDRGPAGDGWDCHVHVFDAAAPVIAGHYRPAQRPLADIEATAATLGVGHLVLVQPSVYGTDNAVLLSALAARPGRHRAVVVIGDAVDDGELDAMNVAGVRGARLNLRSPVGESAAPAARFASLAPRLEARGWHLQWYAAADQLETIAALHAASGITAVLDHLGGLTAAQPPDGPAWRALSRLADLGAWVKLSGWYRLQSEAPYGDLLPATRRLARLFGDRLVWGSDWPFTAFAPDRTPSYASVWAPLVDALGESAAIRLRDRVPPIYR